MKILTNKKVNETIKRIAECQIIANKYINDIEAHSKITHDLADICFDIGGIKGLIEVLGSTLDEFIGREETNE